MTKENGGEITSRELLERTGISRATLNNYIKLGIVPRPEVRAPGPDMATTKRIGYFPRWVSERVELVKRLKRDGQTMDEIIQSICAMEGSDAGNEHGARSAGLREALFPGFFTSTTAEPPPTEQQARAGASKQGRTATLDLEAIEAPAYFVNYQHEIEWINTAAEQTIFRKDIRSIREAAGRNLFRLLLGWEFRSNLANWEELLALHLSAIREHQPDVNAAEFYEGISPAESEILARNAGHVLIPVSGSIIRRIPVRLAGASSKEERYWLYISCFREGILFLFENSESLIQGIAEYLEDRSAVIEDLLSRRMPTLMPFCVLVADLQESCRICAELPPEEYFELIHEMRETLESSFKKYFGIHGKHAGDGMVYYFLKQRDSSYIVNALSCALEIRELMTGLSLRWRGRKKWFNDLYLNMGVNEGEEYFGVLRASSSIEFTALGETINYAARISELARCGSIFVTKNLISKMREAERRQFRIGLHRQHGEGERFIENIYSRVVDLVAPGNPKSVKFMDVAALPVTELMERLPA